MLGEVVPAILPLGATMAVICGARVREIRRRLALNRALHELRRPLQALALSPGPGAGATKPGAIGSLDLALVALDDLDVVVNRSRPRIQPRRISGRALVESAVERWRAPAARSGHSLTLEWRAARALVMADPARVAQALDNLLANALEHGGLRVRIEASIGAAGLRIAIADSGGEGTAARRRRGARRGHGLDVVRRTAEAHGGRFELRRERGRTAAILDLPLAPMPVVVPIDIAARRSARRGSSGVRRGGAGAPTGPRAA